MKKIHGFGFDKESEKFEKELVSGNFDFKKFLKDYQASRKRYKERLKRRKEVNE
jgi:hypothetical protein